MMIINEGSSPRVWGQAIFGIVLTNANGIIPTRVGTSSKCQHKSTAYRDHPHACGDKELFSGDENYHEGSSPRVWGQADEYTRADYMFRIIPTRVGTRVSDDMTFLKKEDHPHACGDKPTAVILSYG